MQHQALAQSIPPPGPVESDTLEAAVADFTPDQLNWASGFLAGLAAARGAAAPAVAQTLTDMPPAGASVSAPESGLTILYGSQTGNGKGVATQVADNARTMGLPVRLVSMAEFEPRKLKNETHVLFVVSTHGEGDPPDDAEDLRDLLFSKKAPKLVGLNYSVLALGDSSYERFCRTGQEFDKRLEELGAVRVFARVDCDVDYEDAAAKWGHEVLDKVSRTLESAVEPGPQVSLLRAVEPVSAYSKENPYDAELLTNQKITGRDSDKDVRHLEFDIEDVGLVFEPGDSLGVIPRNPDSVVDGVIQALDLNPEEPVPGPDGDTSLREVLSADRELTLTYRAFISSYAERSGSEDLRTLLADDRRGDLAAYMAHRQVIDVVREHPAKLTGEEFVKTLRPLTPRLYSIASSPLANPDEVHLTVDVLRYSALGQEHVGAGSNFLAALDEGASAPVFVEPNERFRLPGDPDAPVIMIGPGTGVAPFRAFLQQRQTLGARGANWLFFGARHGGSDFFYQLEWLRALREGTLDRMDVAFSRDQEQKVYVQHRMNEAGRDLYDWLENGAYLYVCGDAKHMAKDVHKGLIDVVTREGGLGLEQAQEYVKILKREGRYQRDVY